MIDRSIGCEFQARQKQQGNFLLLGELSVLTLIWCSFHPSVTTVACIRRPWSFYQKGRWQVTPKHAYTLDPTKLEWADCATDKA